MHYIERSYVGPGELQDSGQGEMTLKTRTEELEMRIVWESLVGKITVEMR